MQPAAPAVVTAVGQSMAAGEQHMGWGPQEQLKALQLANTRLVYQVQQEQPAYTRSYSAGHNVQQPSTSSETQTGPQFAAAANGPVQDKYTSTKLVSDPDRGVITQAELLQTILTPGAADLDVSDLFTFWRPAPCKSRASPALHMNQKQLDIMYAVAGCSDVMSLVSNVLPPMRKALHEVYGIDKQNFATWYKNRGRNPSKGNTRARNLHPTVPPSLMQQISDNPRQRKGPRLDFEADRRPVAQQQQQLQQQQPAVPYRRAYTVPASYATAAAAAAVGSRPDEYGLNMRQQQQGEPQPDLQHQQFQEQFQDLLQQVHAAPRHAQQVSTGLGRFDPPQQGTGGWRPLQHPSVPQHTQRGCTPPPVITTITGAVQQAAGHGGHVGYTEQQFQQQQVPTYATHPNLAGPPELQQQQYQRPQAAPLRMPPLQLDKEPLQMPVPLRLDPSPGGSFAFDTSLVPTASMEAVISQWAASKSNSGRGSAQALTQGLDLRAECAAGPSAVNGPALAVAGPIATGFAGAMAHTVHAQLDGAVHLPAAEGAPLLTGGSSSAATSSANLHKDYFAAWREPAMAVAATTRVPMLRPADDAYDPHANGSLVDDFSGNPMPLQPSGLNGLLDGSTNWSLLEQQAALFNANKQNEQAQAGRQTQDQGTLLAGLAAPAQPARAQQTPAPLQDDADLTRLSQQLTQGLSLLNGLLDVPSELPSLNFPPDWQG